MHEILKETDYSLYKDESNNLWIEVLCGSIGLYEVMVKLLPEEVKKYNSDPLSLKDLAYSISRDPEKYKKRQVRR